jgi:hypothetical protein
VLGERAAQLPGIGQARNSEKHVGRRPAAAEAAHRGWFCARDPCSPAPGGVGAPPPSVAGLACTAAKKEAMLLCFGPPEEEGVLAFFIDSSCL